MQKSLFEVFCHFSFFKHKAEWLGNENRKTMIKVKTIGQILTFKSGTALPSPSQATGSAFYFENVNVMTTPIIVPSIPSIPERPINNIWVLYFK